MAWRLGQTRNLLRSFSNLTQFSSKSLLSLFFVLTFKPLVFNFVLFDLLQSYHLALSFHLRKLLPELYLRQNDLLLVFLVKGLVNVPFVLDILLLL